MIKIGTILLTLFAWLLPKFLLFQLLFCSTTRIRFERVLAKDATCLILLFSYYLLAISSNEGFPLLLGFALAVFICCWFVFCWLCFWLFSSFVSVCVCECNCFICSVK